MNRRHTWRLGLGAAAVAAACLVHCTACAPDRSDAATDTGKLESLPKPVTVTALGRIEPKDPITHISGPSRPSVVIAKLLVAEDDKVVAGQPIAILDSEAEDEARLAQAKARVDFAQREYDRVMTLLKQGISATAQRDQKELNLAVAKSNLAMARATLDLDTVRAPEDGQIVAIHARSGERVGAEGIAELAENEQMYTIAEVYETDISRVALGERARIHSPALPKDLFGTVTRIGREVGMLDVLDTDPVARIDARIIKVQIKLDDSAPAAGLSNLQVDVTIEPLSRTAHAGDGAEARNA